MLNELDELEHERAKWLSIWAKALVNLQQGHQVLHSKNNNPTSTGSAREYFRQAWEFMKIVFNDKASPTKPLDRLSDLEDTALIYYIAKTLWCYLATFSDSESEYLKDYDDCLEKIQPATD